MVQAIRRSRLLQIISLMSPGGFVLIVFFFLPLLAIALLSFFRNGVFTLEAYERSFRPLYLGLFATSIWIAFLTTILSLIIAFPVALFIARLPKKYRDVAVFLVMIPFWTNFLVRTYALQFLMLREGPINSALRSIGLIERPIQMLNTEGAVLIGLIYGNLPFMILPLYTSLEKFDWTMLEAASDLGANTFRSFIRVMLPLVAPGLLAGSILTFIPSIGSYVTADLMGGGQATMLGRVIANQFEQAQNWTFGSALSLLMMIVVTIFAIVYFRIGRGERATLA
jgi:spermidine/putrescine transport system permease protein